MSYSSAEDLENNSSSPRRRGSSDCLAGFVVPFMAVYSPALMLQGDSMLATLYVIVKATLAIGLWGVAAIGFWLIRRRGWNAC